MYEERSVQARRAFAAFFRGPAVESDRDGADTDRSSRSGTDGVTVPSVRRVLAALGVLVAAVAVAIAVGALGDATANAAEACPNEASRIGPSAALPDCRVYEAVSPVATEGNAQVYVPAASGIRLSENSSHGIYSTRQFEVAPTGAAVVYPGSAPPVGGTGRVIQGEGNIYLSTRPPGGGWNAVNIQPSGPYEYQAFSSDLSLGILQAEEPPSGEGPAETQDLYSHPTAVGPEDEYRPAFSRPESGTTPWFAGLNAGTAIAPPSTHLLFGSSRALLEGAGSLQTELGEAAEKAAEEEITGPSLREGKVLYDSVAGQLSLVSVLPDGKPDAVASFGSFEANPARGAPGLNHVISADGSRIFWSGLKKVGGEESGRPKLGADALYVRENDTQPQSALSGGECTEPARACTVQLDLANTGAPGPGGSGQFLAANADGSKVFFLDDASAGLTADTVAASGTNLYEYDFAAPAGHRLTDLSAAAHADVRGFMGASEDGSYLYFVAGGVLASGATAGSCKIASLDEIPEEGSNEEHEEIARRLHEEISAEQLGEIPSGRACNLYLLHEGEPLKFIASLPARDNTENLPFDDPGGDNPGGGSAGTESGDWQTADGFRTAEVTPDGHTLIFMSKARLTGYENKLEGRALSEVFLYRSGSPEPVCISCNPSGEPPVVNALEEGVGGFFPITKDGGEDNPGSSPQPRVISADGARVFFESGEPLVPQDTNGWVDVYEWERAGAGSCDQSQGCVYLLSGGTEPENSYLLGAGSSGDDAIFVTRGQLVTQDQNGGFDAYDARVGGVLAPQEAPPCAGEACRAALGSSPPAPSPGTTTFSGPGNPKPVKCKKGKVKKHGKCVNKKSQKHHKVKKHHSKKASHNRRGGK
jgi:hypothetical protein